MRLAEILGPAPDTPVPFVVDRAWPPLLMKASSGNICTVRPLLKDDRLVIQQCWQRGPSDADTEEVYALLEALGCCPEREKHFRGDSAGALRFAKEYLQLPERRD